MSDARAAEPEPERAGCIACGAQHRERVFPDATGPARAHPLDRCTGCGLVSLANPPSREAVAAAHRTYYGRRHRRFLWLVELPVHRMRRSRARLAAGLLEPGAGVLDVGCGRGAFLRHLAARGFRVRGTEFSKAAASNTLEGVPVDVGEFGPGRYPPGSFDLISIWHVLEHTRDPRRALEAAHEALVPGGALLLALPNYDSWQVRLAGEHAFNLDLPRHVFHFTPATLRALVERAGFRVERLRTGQWEMDPFGLLQSALNRIGLRHNALYDSLRSSPEARADLGPLYRVGLFVAFALGMPLACLASLACRLTGRAGTLILVARKPG